MTEPDDEEVRAALRTIEDRVRSLAARQIRTLATSLGAQLAAGLARGEGPEAGRLVTALDGARANVSATIRAGYRAAHIAAGALIDVDSSTPALDRALTDVRAAFAEAALDIASTVRAAAAGARLLGQDQDRAAVEAYTRAVRRLAVRVDAAATVAVNRGYTDGQLDAGPSATKTWVVGSAHPCPVCAALNGQTIGISEEFDHTATLRPDLAPLRVHHDLQGPPRHPNCRCRLVLHNTRADLHDAAAAVAAAHAGAAVAADYTTLAARDVRRMDGDEYDALAAFLTAVIRRVKDLQAQQVRDTIERGGTHHVDG